MATDSVAVSPVSTSVAPVSRSRVNKEAPSFADSVSAAATTGASLTPVTVMVDLLVGGAASAVVDLDREGVVLVWPAASACTLACLVSQEVMPLAVLRHGQGAVGAGLLVDAGLALVALAKQLDAGEVLAQRSCPGC